MMRVPEAWGRRLLGRIGGAQAGRIGDAQTVRSGPVVKWGWLAAVIVLLAACGTGQDGSGDRGEAADSGDDPTLEADLLRRSREGMDPAVEAADIVISGTFDGLYVPGPPALFTDCRTGVSYELAPSGAADSLAAAYPTLELAPGEPFGLSVDGRRVSTDGDLPALEIAAFRDLRRASSCEGADVNEGLERTEWTLVSAMGNAAPPGAEGTLVFDGQAGTVTGNTGCNSFSGVFDVAGTKLDLSGVGLTRMACAAGMDAVEVDVLEAFRRAGSFRIVADVLELMGEDGVVARYRAR